MITWRGIIILITGHDSFGDPLVYDAVFTPTTGLWLNIFLPVPGLTLSRADHVAIKRYSIEWLLSDNNLDSIMVRVLCCLRERLLTCQQNELKVSRQLRHANIYNFYTSFVAPPLVFQLWIVCPYMGHGVPFIT